MAVLDINSDMGESFGAWTMGDDAAMLDVVSSANVACGFHAGDPLVMYDTVSVAKARGVAVGAHPGFRDLWGFGRRPIIGEKPDNVMKEIAYQIGALQAIAAAAGHRVTHVKTHGSLGNLAEAEDGLAGAVAAAVKAVDRELILVCLPGNAVERAGEKAGLKLAREIYADRTYDDAGRLTSRKLANAFVHDPEEAAERVLMMLSEGAIVSTSGKRIPARIDTVCVHGDSPVAVAMARTLRARLEAAGVAIRPFATTLG
ncbi:MAG: 5-oxoprolinase subunit PxpA [Thalassobaculales bacterium]